MDKIYLLIGNDTPLAVCLRKSEGEETPVPYDLSEARHLRLTLVGHGMRVCAKDIEVSGDDNNVVSGMIPGRSLMKGDYDLEVTFTLDGRDKRFAIDDMFEAVDFLAEDADGEAEGEGAGIFVTVTVQPELIEIAGPTGPQGKSAYQVWLDDGHTGTEDDFFEWLAAQTPNPDWEQNDPSKADYIKNRTHWEEESSTTINDAKLAWSGSTPEDLDFWFHGTNVHIRRTSTGWGLTWEGGELFIDDNGLGYEIGVYNGEEWSINPFDPSYDQQPYPLNVDVVITSGTTVHKLPNKFLDMDSEPTTGSGKPVTSGGVKAAIADFVTRAVNDLLNYYTKTETYTRAEVNQLVAGINNWEIVPVAQLPEASADTMHKIYLVPSSNPKTRNVKDEFITVEVSGAYSWEQIGTTAIDLTNYVTKQDLTEALADYVTSTAFTQALALKQDVIEDLPAIRQGAIGTVKYTSQSLTDAQKEQARTNIGAASDSEVSQLRSDVNKLITSQDFFTLMSLYADGIFLLPTGATSTASGWKVYKLDLSDAPDTTSFSVSSHFTGGNGVSMACGYTESGAFVENYYTNPVGVVDKNFSITPASNVSYILFSKNDNAPISVMGDVPGVFLDGLLDKTDDKFAEIEGTITEMIEKGNVSDSDMTLFASNSLILSDGVVTSGYPGYDLYKLPLSGLSFDVIGITASGHSGSSYYIAYGYDVNGNPVEGYIYKISGVSNYSVTFIPNTDVDYILILQPNKCVVTLYKEGEVLNKMISGEARQEIIIHKETILPSATGDMSLLWRLKALSADTSEEKPGYYHRYEFTLAPGVYNMDCSADVATLPRGVFVPPYTTIIGAGIGVTKLQYLYSGTNDTIMSEHSTLNIPYSATIENLSIEAENIRYAVHSDLPETGKESLANDSVLVMKNVEIAHYGITNGSTPTYNIPNAWGGGTFNNNRLRFENCRFYAAQCSPFANHDRTGLTKSSYFEFISCVFENNYMNADLNDSITNPSVFLNSWGSNVPIYCSFVNCRVMRYIELAVTTNYNASAKSDYYITADGDYIIRVAQVNNSEKDRHWTDGKCKIFKFADAVTMGTPVVMLSTYHARAWSPSGDAPIRLAGVLLHDVEAGGIGVVKMGGFLSNQILGDGHNQASTIGWDGTSWTANAAVKSVAMFTDSIGVMMPYTN